MTAAVPPAAEPPPGGSARGAVLLRLAEWLIRRACRHLPDAIRDDRYREWTAELPHILGEPGIRLAPRRAVMALLFAADQSRGARHLGYARAPHRASGEWLRPIACGGVVGFLSSGVVSVALGGVACGVLCVVVGRVFARLGGTFPDRLAAMARGGRSRLFRDL